MTLAVLNPIAALIGQCASWNLLLDKLSFERGGGAAADDSPKSKALKNVIQTYRTQSAPHLRHALKAKQQWLSSLERQYGPRFRRVTLVNSNRLLLHLGRASVLENVGIYCERTTGLPLIPGTAVKGVLSTWACWEANQNKDGSFPPVDQWTTQRKDHALRIFGSNADTGSVAAGEVVFVGGFPSSLPGLELDIVTPHPDEGRGRVTPNPFLAIAPDCVWHFVLIASSRVAEDEVDRFLGSASTWLEEALTQIGLGAKTAAGYGGFRLLTESEKSSNKKRLDNIKKEWEDAQKTIQKEERLKTLSPEDQAFETFVASIKDWAVAARDILKTEEPNRNHILRYFRSEEGQAVIAAWPKNDKAKQRNVNLKEAGL
jgi:CRISPR type III-B/RAMP module RAMP protein Cmr6